MIIMRHSEGEIWGSHCGVSENSYLVGCDAVSIGLTWIIIWRGGVSKFTIGNRNFNLRRSNVRMRKNTVSNQSLIYWYHFSPCLPQICICLSPIQLPKTILLLRRKNSEGYLPPLAFPHQSYAYGCVVGQIFPMFLRVMVLLSSMKTWIFRKLKITQCRSLEHSVLSLLQTILRKVIPVSITRYAC
jgi:hypothetical protein